MKARGCKMEVDGKLGLLEDASRKGSRHVSTDTDSPRGSGPAASSAALRRGLFCGRERRTSGAVYNAVRRQGNGKINSVFFLTERT